MRFPLVCTGLLATYISTIQTAPVEPSIHDDFLSISGLPIDGLRAEFPSTPESFVTYTGADIEDIRNQILDSSNPGVSLSELEASLIGLGPGFTFDGLASLEDVDDSEPSQDAEADESFEGTLDRRDNEDLDQAIQKQDVENHKPKHEDAAELSAFLLSNKTLAKPAGFIPPYILQRIHNSSIFTNNTIIEQKDTDLTLSATTTATSATAATTSSSPIVRPTTNCDGSFRQARVVKIHKGMDYLRTLRGHAVIAPATCQRVSCSWGAGIYVCNETPASTNDSKRISKAEDKARTTRIRFKDIATGANEILKECPMDWGGWSSGKHTTEDGVTSVIVRGGAYKC